MNSIFKVNRILIYSLLFCLLSKAGLSQNVKAFYVGHSLSDQVAEMVKSLSDNHAAVSFNNWAYQSIPGSPLRFNWQAKDRNDYQPIPPHIYGFYHPGNGLPAGGYNAMVLTESVPRRMAYIDETYQYADSFYRYAHQYNPGIKVYLYEVWHCILSGTPTGCAYDVNSNPWRQRLTDDLPMWESVVDTLNARFQPASAVTLIPAGQGLAQLYDSIQASVVPGISSINSLFSDDIHLTDQGKYFIACIHFAALHNTSPVGLTNQLYSMWGNPFNAPTAAQALKFQQIAWAAVSRYKKWIRNTNDSGTGSLRAAIENAGMGDTLIFDNGITGDTIRLSSAALVINKNIRILQPANGQVIIKGPLLSNIVTVTAAADVTIKNVQFISNSSVVDRGIINHGNLLLENVRVVSGMATGTTLKNYGSVIVNGNCELMQN